jgi:hypothetical protein
MGRRRRKLRSGIWSDTLRDGAVYRNTREDGDDADFRVDEGRRASERYEDGTNHRFDRGRPAH